tara:strand:- start:7754 stop:8248 length:495 start_codon:yes stop_codon:yes gene_type:complete
MTRLNLIEPGHLTRVHLVAEYKELTQFLHLIQRRIDNNVAMDDIPDRYTLNGGHCKFFYNKGKYVYDRYKLLYENMISRDINTNVERFKHHLNRIYCAYTKELWCEYIPTPRDYKIAIDRIAERIIQKPQLYKDKEVFFKNIKHYGISDYEYTNNIPRDTSLTS